MNLLAPDPPAGVLPGADGGAVAVQDFRFVGVPRGGGAVGVQDQGPAPPVDDDLMVEETQQDAVFGAGLAAVGLVPDVVDLACGGGLVAAAGPPAVLVAQDDGVADPGRDGLGCSRCPAAGSARPAGRRAAGGAGTTPARPGPTAGPPPCPRLFYCILLA